MCKHEWLDTIVVGDCLWMMSYLPSGCVDLVFADPPFNIGKDFGNECDDQRPSLEYWEWTQQWVTEVWRILRHGGTCYLKNHWRNVAPFDTIVRSDPQAVVRNLIVWQKGAGLASRLCYSMRWEAIWFATKGDGHTFNLDTVRVPCQTRDPRNNPNGKNPTDCWYIPRVAFGSGERTSHPTQTPEKLLDRIIRASSNPSDTVFDPFMGSGTTAVVAKRLGRHWAGCDTNPSYVKIANERVAKIQATQMELL